MVLRNIYKFSGTIYFTNRRKPHAYEQRGDWKGGIQYAILHFFEKPGRNVVYHPYTSVPCLLSEFTAPRDARFSPDTEPAEPEMAVGIQKIPERKTTLPRIGEIAFAFLKTPTQNMKKLLIRVIKRKDAEAMATANILPHFNSIPTSFVTREEDGSKLLRRNIDSTVSSWITERRENNRVERAAAVRKMLSGEILLAAG